MTSWLLQSIGDRGAAPTALGRHPSLAAAAADIARREGGALIEMRLVVRVGPDTADAAALARLECSGRQVRYRIEAADSSGPPA